MIPSELTYYAYLTGWTAVRRMPERMAYGIFQQIADRTWRARTKGVLQYERNIRRVRPDASDEEIRELSRAMMRSYMRYWCDAFRMPDWSRERMLDLHVQNEHYLIDEIATGEGVIIVGAHAGNYDAGAAFLALKYGSCTTVAERLEPERLFDAFVAFRARNGVEVLGTGTPDILGIMRDRVLSGRHVGFVGERDLSRRGVEVDFFGETAKMPVGVAKLALETGRPFLPVGFYYEGTKPAAIVYPPVEVRTDLPEEEALADALQKAADAMADAIGRYPQDWHMLQKIWVADLDPAKAPGPEED